MSPTPHGRYHAIADHGVVGDCRTAALVAGDGSVDWWCPSRFDAPSVFAAILDRERGGSFDLRADAPWASRMEYVPRTNVLRTEWRGDAGGFEVYDLLPWPQDASGTRLVRLVRGLSGASPVFARFAPRFDYGAVAPRFERAGERRVVARGSGQTLALRAPAPVDVSGDDATCRLVLQAGEEVAFAVSYAPFVAPRPPAEAAADARRLLEATVAAWRAWVARADATGPWADAVERSALALKLLHHEPTGAFVAAATCSLPEWIGGGRNWDYRYAWVRDAVFSVRALAEAGHSEEARRFVDWIVASADPDPAKLRVLYSVAGTGATPERTLDHLEGYRRSAPVRVGNAAEQQYQLDVYGELVEGAYGCGLLDDVDEGRWSYFRSLADFVAANWRRPDQGIWEMRCPPRNFLLSKAMAWAALDRMATVAERRGLPGDLERWREEARTLRAEALEKAWDERLCAFKQSYEHAALDASNLLLPILGFVAPDDPRMLATLDATLERLTSNGLVYRYLDGGDGVSGEEATFTCCAFWLVEALALAGRQAEATAVFEGVVRRATPLGLFAEELDAATGEHLGNFPQAFPHIGLLRAARRLAQAAPALPRPTTVPRVGA